MYYNDFDNEKYSEDKWTPTEFNPIWLYGGYTFLLTIWTIGLIHTVFYIVDFFNWLF